MSRSRATETEVSKKVEAKTEDEPIPTRRRVRASEDSAKVPPKKVEAPASPPAVKPVEKPKKAEVVEEELKREAKKPTTEELYEKFLSDFTVNFKDARDHSVFYRIGNPKNPLQLGGMSQQFKASAKSGVKMCYSLDLYLVGPKEQFVELVKRPEIVQFIAENNLDAELIVRNLITADNHEEMLNNDTALSRLLKNKDRSLELLYSKINEIEDNIKANKRPAKKKDDALRNKIEEYRESGKSIFDVSAWNDEAHTGYKTIPRPSPSNRPRYKKILTSLPICSDDTVRLQKFLTYVGYEPEYIEEVMKEIA